MNPQFLDLNRHGALNPPLSFWWCTVLLLRYWILLAIVAASALVQSGGVQWAYGALEWPMLAAELPMLLLLSSAAQRAPEAGRFPRQLWRYGRELILLSVMLSVAAMAWSLTGQEYWRPVPERLMAALAVAEVCVAVGCWRSPIYRELFNDFPSPAGTTSASG